MRRLALVPILVSAFLFPSAASALGLGDIELQSALNQRLDAEIPLRGVPADRSEDIIVTLASEQAFQDVGLQRPFSLTKLRFEVRRRTSGQYYVHVTSSEAIVEPFLSFLVEVDWPGGNLLREYTVLLDPPVFTTEKSDDAAGTPEAASDGGDGGVTTEGVPAEIERPADEADGADEAQATAAEPAAEPEPAEDADSRSEPAGDGSAATAATGSGEEPADTQADDAAAEPAATAAAGAQAAQPAGDFGDTPVFLQVEREEEEAERRAAEQEAAARSAERERSEAEAEAQAYAPAADQGEPATAADSGAPSEYGPVEEGETLWNIAARLKSGDMTIQQMMLALLRYNPDAFADGNINRLRQGYVLRVPDAAAVRSVSAQQAVARVGEQNALWQEWRRAQGAGDTRRAARAQEQPQASAEAGATTDDGEARLSIVGSEEGGAGSDEQASATSASAQSASEELKLAREQLESAEMEKAELQSRVDELEQTVDKMERLITLRENRLNELQQQLEELRRQEQERAAEQAAEQAAAKSDDAKSDDAESDDAEDEAAAAAGGGSGADGADTGSAGSAGETGSGGGEVDGESSAAAAESASGEAADAGQAAADADATASGGTAEAGGDDEPGATTVTADAGASGDADAPDGGAQGTSAETQGGDGGVVTTRTEPAEPGWLDTISGMAGSVAATLGGMVAGLSAAGGGLFAGPTSPGFLGAAALLALALVLVLVRRRRGAAEPADTDAESFEALAAADEWPAEEEADLDHMDSGSEVVAEELGGTESRERAAAEANLEEQNLDFGGLADLGDEAPAEEESPKDDTVAEADVYLAYGLHQQAEDLLRLALKEAPERADYHEKLLETLYGAGKRDEFVSVARDFQGLTESPQSRPWQRVVAMGKEIAPDESMFSGAADPGIRPDDLHKPKPETTDIELDAGGDSHVDFGFDEEPSGAAGGTGAAASDAFDETQMFETGAFDAGESGGGDEPATADAGGDLEFDLGDLEDLGGGGTAAGGSGQARDQAAAPESGAGDATAAAAGGGADDDALEFDLGDLDLGEAPPETPAAPEEDPEATVAAAGHGDSDPEATVAATGREDFDLDFDAMRTPAAGGDDAGAGSGAHDDAVPDMGALDAGAGEDTTVAAGGGADDDALDLGDIDLGEATAEAGDETAAGETPATGSELDLGELDVGAGAATEADEEATVAGGEAEDDGAFDLSDFDAGPDLSTGDLDAEFADMAGEESTVSGGSAEDTAGGESEPRFDFDVSGLDEVPAGEDTADSAGDEGPEATQSVAGGAGAGLGQEDDEFDTMLDLAKAYIDMGDAESAGNALEEVIQSGNEAQQREARGLLETVQ